MRPVPEPAPDPLQSAHAHLEAGRHAEAFECIRQRIAEQGGGAALTAEATALVAVARVAERAGDAAASRHALEAALELVDWADLHHARGTLLVRTGEHDAARAAFDRALAINPRYRAAALERALLDARAGRVGAAVGALRALSAGDPGRETEALRDGLERLRAHAIEDAVPLLRRALSDRDSTVEHWVDDAQARSAAGEPGAALALLRRAVTEHPGYADLHALLGAHELRAGQLDDGIASLIDALCLNPSFHAARLELARGLEARGERESALREVRHILAVAPGHEAATTVYDRLAARARPATAV